MRDAGWRVKLNLPPSPRFFWQSAIALLRSSAFVRLIWRGESRAERQTEQ
jgi:hypothetical protein